MGPIPSTSSLRGCLRGSSEHDIPVQRGEAREARRRRAACSPRGMKWLKSMSCRTPACHPALPGAGPGAGHGCQWLRPFLRKKKGKAGSSTRWRAERSRSGHARSTRVQRKHDRRETLKGPALRWKPPWNSYQPVRMCFNLSATDTELFRLTSSFKGYIC